jgi:LysM domain
MGRGGITLSGESRLLNVRTTQPARFVLSLTMLTTCVMTALPGPVAAQEAAAQTQTETQREHEVKRGDTLWDLARAYLQNPFLWPLIFEANRSVVENPHWIYPAERLIIPPVVAQSADAPAVAVDVRPAYAEPATSPSEPARSRFYTAPLPPRADDAPTMLVGEDGEAAYPVSPAEWRTVAWLADSTQLRTVGRIEAMEDPSRADDRLATKLHPFDRVHVGRLQGPRPSNGDTLLVVRLGRDVEGHGRVVEPVALLRVEGGTSSMVTGTVVQQHGDGRLGDLVIARDALPALRAGVAQPVSGGAEGELVALLQPQPHPSTADLGFVDLGRSAGVEVGDELMAYVPERQLEAGRAERVPATEVGTLRVVRVEQGTATVRVVGLKYPSLVEGMAVRVVRKMQ